MQGSAGFGLSVDVDACLDQQSDSREEGSNNEGKDKGKINIVTDCKGKAKEDVREIYVQ